MDQLVLSLPSFSRHLIQVSSGLVRCRIRWLRAIHGLSRRYRWAISCDETLRVATDGLMRWSILTPFRSIRKLGGSARGLVALLRTRRVCWRRRGVSTWVEICSVFLPSPPRSSSHIFSLLSLLEPHSRLVLHGGASNSSTLHDEGTKPPISGTPQGIGVCNADHGAFL